MSPHVATMVKSQLQRLVSPKSKRETENDRQLLLRYSKSKDQQAFKQLVLRHGTMVLGVARRALGDYHTAEDVLQSTFMVLAKKAKWPGWQRSIAPWLYITAYRLACNARKRGKKHVSSSALTPERHASAQSEELTEVSQMLDAELMRLAKLYRTPLILCYLEGRTRDEAAEQLDISLATLKRRLNQGRHILRVRLERKGIAWSAVGWSFFLADQKLSAAVVESVVQAIAKVRLLPAFFIFGSGFTWWMASGFLMLSILGFLGSHLLHRDQADDSPKRPQVFLAAQSVHQDSLPEGSIRRFGSMDFRLSQKGVRFSPDGKYFVTNRGKALVYIDPETGQEVKRLIECPYNIQQWVISPDGKTALVYGDSFWNQPDALRSGPIPWFKLELWDLVTGSLLRPVNWRPHGAWWTSIKDTFGYFAPDSKSVITNEGVGARTTTLWDIETGNELWQQSGATLGFIDNGKNIVTYTSDHQKSGRIHILEATTGKELRGFDAAPELDLMGWDKVLSPDGKSVFLASTLDNLRDYRVRSWNVQTGVEEMPLKGHEMWVTRLAVSPDNRLVATISQDHTIRIWDRVQAKCLQTIKTEPREFNNLAFHPDSKTLWIMFSNWPQRYDVSTGKLLTTGNPGHEGNIIGLAFAADGRTLWTTSYDRTTRTWDVTTGRELQQRQDSSLGWVVKAAISDDRAYIAFSGRQDIAITGQRFRVAVYELSTGKLIRIYETRSPHGELSLSPDHKLLALNDNSMTVWSLDKDRQLYESTDLVSIGSFAWTPDGTQLVALARGNDVMREVGATTAVWNARTGQKERVLSNERDSNFAFSPHAQTLALSRSGKVIQLVEFATGKERYTIRDLPVNAGKLVFSPDGRWLAANMDRHIWVWNAFTGEKVAEFPGHDYGVTSLHAAMAFSPDSKLIASTGSDCTVLIWDLHSRVQNLPAPQPVTLQMVQQAWEALEKPDGRAAFQAMNLLTLAPEQTIRLAQDRLRTAAIARASHVTELIRDLDNSQFAPREKASNALEEYGEAVLPALEAVLEKKPALELQRRAQKIIDTIRSRPASPEFLVHLRAIEVLERIGTKAAQTVLAKLAEGNPASQRTKDAKAALARVNRNEGK